MQWRVSAETSARALVNSKEGVPYQTLVSSVLHKYAAGSFIELRSAWNAARFAATGSEWASPVVRKKADTHEWRKKADTHEWHFMR